MAGQTFPERFFSRAISAGSGNIASPRASRPFEERLREARMPNLHVLTRAGESPTYPIIRKIGFADLKDAAAKGIEDFWVMPTHVIFLAIIYPIVGLILARM